MLVLIAFIWLEDCGLHWNAVPAKEPFDDFLDYAFTVSPACAIEENAFRERSPLE